MKTISSASGRLNVHIYIPIGLCLVGARVGARVCVGVEHTQRAQSAQNGHCMFISTILNRIRLRIIIGACDQCQSAEPPRSVANTEAPTTEQFVYTYVYLFSYLQCII